MALADRKSRAAALAQQQMDRVLAQDYDEIASFQGSFRPVHLVTRGRQISTNFLYRVEIEQPDPQSRIKNVDVHVEWGNSPTHRVTLSSLKGEMW